MHVAIRFIAGTPNDNLALAVYRGNRRIGASTATVGTAQSVLIPAAENSIGELRHRMPALLVTVVALGARCRSGSPMISPVSIAGSSTRRGV